MNYVLPTERDGGGVGTRLDLFSAFFEGASKLLKGYSLLALNKKRKGDFKKHLTLLNTATLARQTIIFDVLNKAGIF